MDAGRLVVMGSGETSPTMVATHRAVLEAVQPDRVTVLDTTFGFQENADQLTARIAGYFATSLGVECEVATLRRPDPPVLEREQALATLGRARYVFAGPGSPSYAISVWESAGIAAALREVISLGGAVVFASAAALTVGVKTIPVYEIYKVGAEPFWLDGLDLTSAFGLPAVFVPHWNNAEGGDHDTSHCFIGTARFERLAAGLDVPVLGIDEHTALDLDFAAGTLAVTGKGEVTVGERRIPAGEAVPLREVAGSILDIRPQSPAPRPVGFSEAMAVGDVDAAVAAMLAADGDSLPAMILDLAEAARRGVVDRADIVGGFVDLLVELRAGARAGGDYDTADRIRDGLVALGVEVHDTPDGTTWALGVD